jgi:hypothetical protein
LDATGIEGGWDFTLTFDPNAGMMMGPGRAEGGQTATEFRWRPIRPAQYRFSTQWKSNWG